MVQLNSTPECTTIWQFRLCFSLHVKLHPLAGKSMVFHQSGHCDAFQVKVIWKLFPTNIRFKLEFSFLMADHIFWCLLAVYCISPHTLNSNSFCLLCCSCEWVVSSVHFLNVCLHSMHFGFLFISLCIPIVLTFNVPSDVKFNCIRKFVVAMNVPCKEWLSKKTTFCSHYKC